MIGRVDDVACSCQDGEDGESKRDSYELCSGIWWSFSRDLFEWELAQLR